MRRKRAINCIRALQETIQVFGSLVNVSFCFRFCFSFYQTLNNNYCAARNHGPSEQKKSEKYFQHDRNVI